MTKEILSTKEKIYDCNGMPMYLYDGDGEEEELLGIMPNNQIVDVCEITLVKAGCPVAGKSNSTCFHYTHYADGFDGLYDFFVNMHDYIREVREKRIKARKGNVRWEQRIRIVGWDLLQNESTRKELASLGWEDFLYNYNF